MSVSLLLSTMLLSFQLSPILFRTFNCEFFTRPPLIIMGHQCLLSNTHDSFTRVEIDTPETQQTNPQMTNAVRVCTMPSVFLQSTNNSTRSHGNWLNYTLKKLYCAQSAQTLPRPLHCRPVGTEYMSKCRMW